eukprot:TRINITY_DN8857_c0_g1_i1.p2 TRINITY_DN8857_c0_g1~~TRINITY_DN8857_c0_g1_i1.p2  ORF type:complete len:131 (+),score=23.18 TRINITY_DN8857_c0_g1_i1:431-823(+)
MAALPVPTTVPAAVMLGLVVATQAIVMPGTLIHMMVVHGVPLTAAAAVVQDLVVATLALVMPGTPILTMAVHHAPLTAVAAVVQDLVVAIFAMVAMCVGLQGLASPAQRTAASATTRALMAATPATIPMQ